MLSRTVTFAAALALVACSDAAGLLGPSPAGPAAGTAESAPAQPDGAGGNPAPAAETAAAPAPSPTVAPPAPPPAVAPAAPDPSQAVAPAADVAPPPAPPGAACDAVTADGPAREIDLDAVRRTLRGSDFRRGSFETVHSYRARILPKLEAVEALAQAQSGRSDLVFSVPIPAYRTSYNAETRELGIGSDLGLLRSGSAIGMGDFVLVSSSEHQIGSQLDTVGYGAKAAAAPKQEVARIRGDQLGVILPGGNASGWPGTFARVRVRMTPAEAAAARESLAVLFVAHLQEPYFATGEFLQEPRPGDPVDKRLLVEALKVAVDCAAIYDRRTGKLIRQILPASPAPAGAPAG
jgi:hypothetical protein